MAEPAPKLGAIAVVYRDGAFLLVKRGKEPNLGLWGFPGGHVEFGETGFAAAVRELHEETGITAEAEAYLTCVDAIGEGYHYLIAAVTCRYLLGDPVAADDAADARWVRFDDILAESLPMSPMVKEVAELAVARVDSCQLLQKRTTGET